MEIKIKFQDKEIEANLNETETSKKILESLPIEGNINLWGDEIYFKIPVSMGLEEPIKQNMEIGNLAYWPEGNAFCIFFGRTPASINSEPRAIVPITFLGNIEKGKTKIFKEAKEGDKIILEKI